MHILDILNLSDINNRNLLLSEPDYNHRVVEVSDQWFVAEIHRKFRLPC
jgi:hypothetical protein